jgi:hypothetical protein
VSAAIAINHSAFMYALSSNYRREDATSDTVIHAWRSHGEAVLKPKGLIEHSAMTQTVVAQGLALAGMGRLNEVLGLFDSVVRVNPQAALGLIGWPLALGIAPPGWGAGKIDPLIKGMPPGRDAEYPGAMRELIYGRVGQGRRRIAAALAIPDTSAGAERLRGLLIGADGWASLLEGDTVGGIRRLRAGIDTAASPNAGEPTAFMRFQLALALSARPETRAEGIRRLQYGFDMEPGYIIPLTYLALGRAYEAAGSRDSAAYAYGRFVRLWDKADPPLQGRVREAKEALARLAAEPRQ